MLIYNYDPTTFEYVSSEEAGINPLKEDEPIIPACATTIAPLEAKKGCAIIWIGNKWNYTEDHRGETWFNVATEQPEVITFIGDLDKTYVALDDPRADIPEEPYWVYDEENKIWVGQPVLYKQYILNNFSEYWNLKQNTPFEFEGHKYLPLWRDLYDSIFNTLQNDVKKEYRLQDADNVLFMVDKKTMRPIYTKMAEIVDNMYTDKQDLQNYFVEENDFNNLEKAFNDWFSKIYN